MIKREENIRPIPEAYLAPAARRGTIRRVDYVAEDYTDPAKTQDKFCYVYTPYGYDSAKQYDILYLIHGGGGNANSLLHPLDDTSPLKCTLDHLIEDGILRPMLVCTPTYYPMDNKNPAVPYSQVLVRRFSRELRSAILPAVEGVYSTFAADTSDAALRASRDHRAIGGFSMGSVTTWFVLQQAAQYFRTYFPMSGDCWIHERRGAATFPTETAVELASGLLYDGIRPEDVLIYCATGSDDIAWDAVDVQIEEMAKVNAFFRYGENLRYICKPGGLHRHEDIFEYLYNMMPVVWPGK